MPQLNSSEINEIHATYLNKLILTSEDIAKIIKENSKTTSRSDIIQAINDDKIRIFKSSEQFAMWMLQEYSKESLLDMVLNMEFDESVVGKTYADICVDGRDDTIRLDGGQIAYIFY